MSLLILVFFLLLHLSHASSDVPDDFIFYGYNKSSMELGDEAKVGPNGLIQLTGGEDGRLQQFGHVFYSHPLQFKNSSTGSVLSFSTSFVFAIISQNQNSRGHGIAFVISPTKDLFRALPSDYLGLFDRSSDGDPSNHIFAIEMDTVKSQEFSDIDDNHVGIDINGLKSVSSTTAGYYTGRKSTLFRNLDLAKGDPIQVWVDYSGLRKQLNVTLAPLRTPKPLRPLLSLTRDLSHLILQSMYVGFSSSTGSSESTHDIIAWSFKMNGEAQPFEIKKLPKIRTDGHGKRDQRRQTSEALVVLLSVAATIFVLAIILAIVLILRRNIQFREVVEDWEIQYGPHRFKYRDLFVATKGFKDREILGRGGFGQVYRGVLPKTKIPVAVKRISHDSRQGLREFVAEIATIGRLRHPNLVRLLGYCRRKGELLLVYDFMPNGSLNTFLFDQPELTLDWAQRFKIIKDVASALFYLHHEWVQVVVHRDIKASNVLLDSEMNGRLGDFGLAKWYDHGATLQTSYLAGTPGYIAPELARTGKASTSSDLFAFGTFLLEVVCGRRPVEPGAEPGEVLLVDWVADCWDRGALLETVDPKLGMDYVAEEAELVLKLALLCSHPVAGGRPSMLCVVQLLEGDASLVEELNANVLGMAEQQMAGNHEKVSLSASYLSQKDSVSSLTMTEELIADGR